MPRALLSVSDKTGLLDFARGLRARGFELVSTGGTARTLTDAGLEVRSVSDVTGFPEMMEGRVKTLHPAVYGGILARRAHAQDLASARAHGIGLIDLVCVNLYPFAQAAATVGIAFEALVEQIDVGGPTLVRAAAKNFVDVLVVVEPADYDGVLREIDRPQGPALSARLELATRAFAHTAEYDRAIAASLKAVRVTGDQLTLEPPQDELFPDRLSLSLAKLRDLRYGENPHQHAAWYADPKERGFAGPAIVQGKELSFTNLLDLDAAARLVLEFEEPASVVIKHTNPCGAATGGTLVDAYTRARDADAIAAFGGVVGLNRVIDEATAHALVSTFIEAVVAPGLGDASRAILAAKPNMRVVTADFSTFAETEAPAGSRRDMRSVLGALLVQERDEVVEARPPWPSEGLNVVTKRPPTADEWRALSFAWRIAAHVKSNSVVFTTGERTVAMGAGQMSRVDAVRVAIMKAEGSIGASAGQPLAGSVAASDAFFPFRDGVDAVAAAGATAVVQPGGSMRDKEVIAAADEHGLAMVFTGKRHFRH